jgi:hypothetical protein
VSPLPTAVASGSHLRNEIDANAEVPGTPSDNGDDDDRMSVDDEDAMLGSVRFVFNTS